MKHVMDYLPDKNQLIAVKNKIEPEAISKLPPLSSPATSSSRNMFPIMEIEEGDLTSINSMCMGYVHGGKITALKDITSSNALLCSFLVWKNGLGNTSFLKDRAKDIRNKGVYFRFVKHSAKKSRDEQIISTLKGNVGASGGAVFYMHLDESKGKWIATMSSCDAKNADIPTYRSVTSASTTLKGAVDASQKPRNKAEIAFFEFVPLNEILYIYLDTKKYMKHYGAMLEGIGFEMQESIVETHEGEWIKFINKSLEKEKLSLGASASRPSRTGEYGSRLGCTRS